MEDGRIDPGFSSFEILPRGVKKLVFVSDSAI
jgi:hypothetical protein